MNTASNIDTIPNVGHWCDQCVINTMPRLWSLIRVTSLTGDKLLPINTTFSYKRCSTYIKNKHIVAVWYVIVYVTRKLREAQHRITESKRERKREKKCNTLNAEPFDRTDINSIQGSALRIKSTNPTIRSSSDPSNARHTDHFPDRIFVVITSDTERDGRETREKQREGKKNIKGKEDKNCIPIPMPRAQRTIEVGVKRARG